MVAKGASCEVSDIEDESEEIPSSADADGEVDPMRMGTGRGKPTARHVEEHERTHLPFRSWCRWCVLGRGRGLQRRACAGAIVPTLGIDYFYFTSKEILLEDKLKMNHGEIESSPRKRQHHNMPRC